MKLYVKNELGSIETEGDNEFCVNAVAEFRVLCDGVRSRIAANQKDLTRRALFREQQQMINQRDDASARLRAIEKELRGANL